MNQKQKSIITEVTNLLQTRYGDDASGHDFLHIRRVYRLALKLARGQQVDLFLVAIGALLHDVDDFKFRKPGENEIKNTQEILSGYRLDEQTLTRIYDIVTHVSFKGASGHKSHQKTPEGRIVQDADRLDAMGAIGIARCFAYNGSRGNPIYTEDEKPRSGMSDTEYVKISTLPGYGHSAINHFYEKLLLLYDLLNTDQAKKIARKRHKFLELYLREFFRELEEDR